MPGFTRTLNFQVNNLGKEATLVLTFDDDKTPGIYKTVFPTALKVTSFAEKGNYNFRLVYHADLGFTRAQVAGGIVEPASTYIPIDIGHKTTLTKHDNVYEFTNPAKIPKPKQIVAQNLSGEKEDIGVGFFDSSLEDPPSTVLVFPKVGNTSSTQCEFHPVLRGYIVSDYQESQLITGQVSSPVIFKENLTDLEPKTKWRLTYSNSNGEYHITQQD